MASSFQAADLSTPLENVESFIESDFPFFSTTVDWRSSPEGFPESNLTPRGVVLQLGGGYWACFDPDLLRMSAIWQGGFKGLRGMAHTSYLVPGKKADAGQDNLTEAEGSLWLATGLIPGGSIGEFQSSDPRRKVEDPTEVGRGPLPASFGRWNGLYLSDSSVVLSYRIGSVEILERICLVRQNRSEAVVRTFRIAGDRAEDLFLTLGQHKQFNRAQLSEDAAAFRVLFDSSTQLRVGLIAASSDAKLDVRTQSILTLRVARDNDALECSVVCWKGGVNSEPDMRSFVEYIPDIPDIEAGTRSHWPKRQWTQGRLSKEEAAFVVDEIPLPFPNPWKRNVRPCALDFTAEGRAFMATYEGDIWALDGLKDSLNQVAWKRYASGFAESMGLAIREDEVFVYSRAGITRLHDLNNDGEADFYENFCDLPVQSAETREFPLDMKLRPDGGFYLAKGGIHQKGKALQNGTILSVDAQGKTCVVVADGLREPFIGVDPKTGFLTATDQQGHEVPATPIYAVNKGNYFGFHWADHGDSNRPVERPITWIPHLADNSASSQLWMRSKAMGPLNDRLVHLSYGRPAMFQVFLNETTSGWQGGVVEIPAPLSIPVLQGSVHPLSGNLYLCGFQIYGSNARELAGVSRVRYTGLPDDLPRAVKAFSQGIRLEFGAPLDDAAASDIANYRLYRWNYKRTLKYGSPHYRMNGEPGQDYVAVVSVRLSTDRQSVFLVVPDMREAMQMALHMDFLFEDGRPIEHSIYLTVNELVPTNGLTEEFGSIDFEGLRKVSIPSQHLEDSSVAGVEAGKRLYQTMGCVACHSIDGQVEGKTGPTLKGLHGSMRELGDGRRALADEAYLRASIENPDQAKLKGYDAGMPSYQGILNETQVESLVMFIKTIR